ncbi:hypothetical protein [Pseudodesulfovibrio tunisiensis]|uniref:hypothetical protein n=1 Tax=Pseudodesulfovibrio tunisiensis TaxID=463192 RepID=UPI001FB28223|nr:hypothetical protein [Pseudodesulfovibrio tunisiensis]
MYHKKQNWLAIDFDGTLLNSLHRHLVVLNFTLKILGIAIQTNGFIAYKREGYNNIDFLTQKGLPLLIARQIQSKWVSNIEKTHFLKHDTLFLRFDHILKNNYQQIQIDTGHS